MKLIRKAGATSNIFQVFVRDSSSTTGAGLTGLTNASANLSAYYHRDTDTTATAISLVTMTVGTFTSSGFKEIDSTNMPGWYQFCPPDAALASGAKSCAFHLKGATNMAPLPIEVQLVAYDPDDAAGLGLTNLDAAVSSRSTLTQTQVTGGAYSVQSASCVLGDARIAHLDADMSSRLAPTVAGRTLDVSATGEAGLDWANVGSPTTAVALTGTTISTSQAVASVSGAVGSVTGDVGGSVGSVVAAVTLSAGDSPVMQSGTASAGGASTITIQTALGADSLPVGCRIKITGGTGADQCRVITGYVNATKVVTVDRAWTTNPDATSVYSILYDNLPALSSGLKVSEVTLVDTLTTYTGNTPQTGDAYARIGATGSGLTSLAPAATALSTAQWTNTRAGYLDNLSGGAVALASGVTVTTNNDKTGYSLVSTGLDLVLVAGKTLPNALKYIGASVAGTLSGSQTVTEVFTDFSGATALTITVDSSGNRSAITYG